MASYAEGHCGLEEVRSFWRHGQCSVRTKIIAYQAMARAILLYGMESLVLTPSLAIKLNTFPQLQGLRQILGICTAYINRANTNERVYALANLQWTATGH